ncbi:alpha/beta fold hydrolase [Haliea sp. E17]|uniref:alpha/beta fold hydrolase n=1 Tax=Haliea sp. E17 TaxID=3401576 RepID=UPI003AAF41C3
MSQHPESAPDWFVRAIHTPRESCIVQVDGCAIHYLRWGDRKRPGLVFVPPSGGHAHWFAHVAPLLADQFHVIALDPAGSGDSGRRDSYGQDSISAEILSVCADSGMFSAKCPPTVVGHSAGAQWVVRTAQAHGKQFLGVIAIDGLRYDELEKDHAVKILKGRTFEPRPAKVYPSREEALAKFRLAPAPLQEVSNTFVVDYIAEHSFRETDGGWTTKYDPAQGATIDLALELKDALGKLACHGAALYSEFTHLAEADVADRMGELNGPAVPVFIIPGTSHYPQIDQPFAFVAALKGVVLTWIASRG